MQFVTSRRLLAATGLVIASLAFAFLMSIDQPNGVNSNSAENISWGSLLAATSAEAAQVDYFLKVDGIDGESTDSRHAGEIEIESFSWGASQTGTHSGGGGGAGKVNMQDFHFVMKTNKASPKLFMAVATGEHIQDAVLTLRKSGKDQQEFLKVKLSDLLVSSYQTGGSSSDVIPTGFSVLELQQDRV